MSIGISKLFDDAELLADQGRLTLAKNAWEGARRLTKIPDRRAWATFNLGILYWVHFGDGVNARCEFLSAIKDLEDNGYGKNPNFKTLHANAVENAMLCALSYDEFEELAEKLSVLAPNEPILSGLLPKVRKFRESGGSWAEFSLINASAYYDRSNPKLDKGRYGEAMSIYHLLLSNRQKLRLKREDWSIALAEYCALAHRLSSNCQLTRGGEKDFNSPEEFLSILTQTLPFIDEYLAANPGDKIIKEQKDLINQVISIFRQRWTEISSSNSKFQMSRSKADFNMSRSTSMIGGKEKGIFSLFFPVICTVIGIFLGNLWGGVIGMLIGLAITKISNFSRKKLRHFRCDFCGRFFEKAEIPKGVGVKIRKHSLISGQIGFGFECVECQRIICSDCEVFCSDDEQSEMKCRCGSVKFRSVYLAYR